MIGFQNTILIKLFHFLRTFDKTFENNLEITVNSNFSTFLITDIIITLKISISFVKINYQLNNEN